VKASYGLRVVQARKPAVVFNGRSVVGASRLYIGVENPEVCTSTSEPDCRSVPAVWKRLRPLQPGLALSVWAAISIVLRVRAQSEICPGAVQAVPVDVVDQNARWSIKDQPVKLDPATFSVASLGILIAPSQNHEPFDVTKPLEVLVIDNRDEAFGEWDFARHGLQPPPALGLASSDHPAKGHDQGEEDDAGEVERGHAAASR
jgi:hypothetical protein